MELEIAPEHDPRIALEPGIDRGGKRADAGDRRDAERQASEKDPEATQAIAHLASRQAECEGEGHAETRVSATICLTKCEESPLPGEGLICGKYEPRTSTTSLTPPASPRLRCRRRPPFHRRGG